MISQIFNSANHQLSEAQTMMVSTTFTTVANCAKICWKSYLTFYSINLALLFGHFVKQTFIDSCTCSHAAMATCSTWNISCFTERTWAPKTLPGTRLCMCVHSTTRYYFLLIAFLSYVAVHLPCHHYIIYFCKWLFYLKGFYSSLLYSNALTRGKDEPQSMLHFSYIYWMSGEL